MGGRSLLRRGPATLLIALALALALLPLLGSRLVPAPATAADAPVATVVHEVADDVLRAPPVPSVELRTRLLAPGGVPLAVLVAVAVALVGVSASIDRDRRSALDRSALRVTSASGRAPPRSLPHR